MNIWRLTQPINDLKCRRLLALNPNWINAIDQSNRVIFGKFTGENQTIVKIAFHLKQHCTMNNSLGKFSHGDFAFRDQHRAGHAGLDGISRGTGGRITR